MLVLSRKKDEVVVVGPDGKTQLKIYVVEIRQDQVRLGFETVATKEELPIHRKEVYDAIHHVTVPIGQENQE